MENKGLIETLSLLDATLTKNREGDWLYEL
jgi:hypothetical protein